jgi:hypothetical protein
MGINEIVYAPHIEVKKEKGKKATAWVKRSTSFPHAPLPSLVRGT